MTLFNLRPEDSLRYPFVGILDLGLNAKSENMLKYQPTELKKTDDITTETLKSFVS